MNYSKQCIQCGKLFYKSYWESRQVWKKRKYCSNQCAGKAWIGHSAPKSAFKKGHIPWNKNKHLRLNDCLEKWRKKTGGESKNHPNWKGENAKYAAIHMWVRAHKKKPNRCNDCGKIGNSHQLHWTNINHKYRRNLDDYIVRCPTCHKKYDLKNGLCQH